jgi:hypothetical protein
MNNYNFPVELQPIMTLNPTQGTDVIKGKLAVVRQDSGETLGIVSNKYGLLKHETVIDNFRKVLDNIKYQEKIEIVKNGAYMFATYKLTNEKIEIVKGDIVNLQFIIKNSYNGTNSLQVSLGAFRLICSNGMVIGKEFFNFSQRHIGALDILSFTNRIPQLSSQFKNTLPIMQTMDKQKIENPDELFKNKILPKYINEEAKKIYEKSENNTVWEFYNSLTATITYKLRKQNPFAEIYFGKLAWEYAVSIIK